MVRRAEVRRKASERGVPERSIEHDYCLTWLLIAIGSDDFLLERVVLKGGTCLRKVYFPEWRYSEVEVPARPGDRNSEVGVQFRQLAQPNGVVECQCIEEDRCSRPLQWGGRSGGRHRPTAGDR